MKRLLIAASLFAAVSVSAAQWDTVLTDDNTLWSANTGSVSVKLDLMQRNGDVIAPVRVPGTEDATIESQPRIAWDSATNILFVTWLHGNEITIARRDAKGVWSDPVVLAEGTNVEGLQLVLTRSSKTTLLHAAWWAGSTAEYALAAFDGAEMTSKVVTTLDQLAAVTASSDFEDTGEAIHPPLAMVRNGEGVEVAYGAARSTAITRFTIKPEKLPSDARIWRPVGRAGRRTDPARLVSTSTAPVQSFIVDGRIVLYTPDAKFRYVVLDNGKWTPVRMLVVDGKTLTTEELLSALRRSVQEHGADDEAASQ